MKSAGSKTSERSRRIKLRSALLKFRSGEISAGAAAEIAEVDRFAFAAECNQFGIPLLDYPSEDLSAELATIQHAYEKH